jgi:hypothetical protein
MNNLSCIEIWAVISHTKFQRLTVNVQVVAFLCSCGSSSRIFFSGKFFISLL